MAGDWIKFELATLDKPEVCQIADLANIDLDAVVGKLLRVWGWFDQQTELGNAPSVTKKLLDRLVGVSGFCDHMVSVGWLIEADGVISIPNFDRHNGKTAKNRSLTALRVASHKKVNGKGNAASVTQPLAGALPKEEKRREEDKSNTPLPPEAPKPKPKPPKFDPLNACPANVTPAVWAQWVACRKEQGKPLKETTCTAQAEQLAGHPNPDEVIRRSIAGGWQGLFPDKVTSASVHQHPASKHTNFDDLDYTAGTRQLEDGSRAF